MSNRVRKSEKRKLRRKRKTLLVLKRSVLFLIFLSFLLVILFLAYSSFMTGLFNVKKIEVNGSKILPEEEIIKASGIKEGDNIFLLQINKARYGISEIISAQDIQIKKVYPDTVEIDLVENQPLCVISYSGENYYLDDEGVLMEKTQELGKADTPILSGFSSYEFKNTGDKITAEPDYKFQQVLDMLKLFKKNGFLQELSEISITPENTYKIITKNGVLFTVKNLSNLREYFDYVSAVIENGESNVDINLASSNNPIRKAR